MGPPVEQLSTKAAQLLDSPWCPEYISCFLFYLTETENPSPLLIEELAKKALFLAPSMKASQLARTAAAFHPQRGVAPIVSTSVMQALGLRAIQLAPTMRTREMAMLGAINIFGAFTTSDYDPPPSIREMVTHLSNPVMQHAPEMTALEVHRLVQYFADCSYDNLGNPLIALATTALAQRAIRVSRSFDSLDALRTAKAFVNLRARSNIDDQTCLYAIHCLVAQANRAAAHIKNEPLRLKQDDTFEGCLAEPLWRDGGNRVDTLLAMSSAFDVFGQEYWTQYLSPIVGTMYKPHEIEAFIDEVSATFDIEDEGETLWFVIASKTLAYYPTITPQQAAELAEVLEEAPNFPYKKVIDLLWEKSR